MRPLEKKRLQISEKTGTLILDFLKNMTPNIWKNKDPRISQAAISDLLKTLPHKVEKI